MAVSRDLLYSVLAAYKAKRDRCGYATNMRVLRAMMEYGAAVEKDWLSDRFTGYADHADVWAHKPSGPEASCWINPMGTVFSIHYGGHDRFAYLVTGSFNTATLEHAGWIHVSDRRIDIEMPMTPAQERTVQELQARGFRVADRAYRSRPDPQAVASIHPGLHGLRMLSEYNWEDPRWWEAKGIPRVAHRVSAPHERHTDDWRKHMTDRLYDEDRSFWSPDRIGALANHYRAAVPDYLPYRLECMEQGDY